MGRSAKELIGEYTTPCAVLLAHSPTKPARSRQPLHLSQQPQHDEDGRMKHDLVLPLLAGRISIVERQPGKTDDMGESTGKPTR